MFIDISYHLHSKITHAFESKAYEIGIQISRKCHLFML